MKRPALTYIVEILLFLILLGGVFLLVGPVSSRLDHALQTTRDSLLLQLENKTGLLFSYESMSPSLFRSVRVKNLIVKDSTSNSIVARFPDTEIQYSIFELIFGNPEGSIREIHISNAILDIDEERNRAMLERFSRDGESSGDSLLLSSIIETGDITVQLRNISFTWKDSQQMLHVLIPSGTATLGSGGIGFNLLSRMDYTHGKLARIGPVSAELAVNGSLDPGLETGSSTITLDYLSGRRFSFSRFSVVASYRRGILQLNSVQDLQPVDISFAWNIPGRAVSLSLECENLFPLQWITLDDSVSLPRELENATLSGTARFSSGGNEPMAYAVDMSAELPPSILGGGTAVIKADGDDSIVYSHALGLHGPDCDFNFNGLYNFRENIPEGLLAVERFALPGGPGVSGNLYVQRTGKGFEGIIPELSVHDARYSSVSLLFNPRDDNVMEFSLDALDTTGRISAEGTYTRGDAPFFEGYLAFDSVSVSNTAVMVHQILSPDAVESRSALKEQLDPFGLTTEIYFSTDLKQFSFNCTRLVAASSEKNGLYVLLSAKGNESSLDITDITISPDRLDAVANIHAEYDTSGDIVFDTDFTVNSIPYYFTGMYSDRNLSLYGDYSMAVSMFFNPSGSVTGILQTNGLPLPLKSLLLSLSLDTEFRYIPEEGFRFTINEGSLEEVKGILPLDTRVKFAGYIENTGVFLHEIAMYDRYSSVRGSCRLNILTQDDGTKQFDASLDLAAPETGELYRFEGTMVKTSELFFEANAVVENLPFMRVANNQNADNLASLTASISGTPETLFAAAELSTLNFRVSDSNLTARGSVLLEDRLVSLYDSVVSWSSQTLTDIEASVSLDDLKADLKAHYSGILDDSPVTADLSAGFLPMLEKDDETGRISISDIESFTVTAVADAFRWTSIMPDKPFPLTIIREPGITALYVGPNDQITGFLLDDGTVSLHATGDSPVTFNADGTIDESEISVSVTDFYGRMEKVWPFTNIPYVAFDSGEVTGSFEITGLLRDPEFYGTFQTNNVIAYSPDHLVEKFYPEPFMIKADGKTLSVEPFLLRSDKSEFVADAVAVFDRWIPNSVELHVETLPGKPILVDTENPYFSVEGRATCNLYMSFSKERGIIVKGPIGFDRGSFAIMFSGFMDESDKDPSSSDVFVDLDLEVGKKVEFRWPSNDFPILRGLIQADEPVKITYDSAKQSFSLKGYANLKGGELFYIKRSFYLRQGSISFNENQDMFDPMISLRAEIRERDEKGEQVRIILSVENQPISSFTPILYSEPPKSSVELMALLGQAASADSTQDTLLRDTIVTASDIFAQMGLFRTAENTVRDFLNLDIFSIRTLLIQNAILQQSMQPSSANREMTIGNYFDNTTVYMGKYFGSAVYADALLHFSYYDPLTAQDTKDSNMVYENMLFQPELGLEITSPFFTIRWGIVPDSQDTFFIADTSVTLSWKFSY